MNAADHARIWRSLQKSAADAAVLASQRNDSEGAEIMMANAALASEAAQAYEEEAKGDSTGLR